MRRVRTGHGRCESNGNRRSNAKPPSLGNRAFHGNFVGNAKLQSNQNRESNENGGSNERCRNQPNTVCNMWLV